MEGSDGQRRRCTGQGTAACATAFRALSLVLLAGLVVLVACASQPPTATPAAGEEASPVPTFTPAPAETSSGSGEPTPAMAEAPAPLSPEDGASLQGAVELSWEWTGQLAADQYYEVRVWLEGQAPEAVAWQKETTLADVRLPEGSYQWSVVVVREAGTGEDGSKKWEAVSQESPAWAFARAATTSGGETLPVAPGDTVSGDTPVSGSTSLRHGPGVSQVARVGGILGLGLALGLVLVPAKPGWLRIRRRRQ